VAQAEKIAQLLEGDRFASVQPVLDLEVGGIAKFVLDGDALFGSGS